MGTKLQQRQTDRVTAAQYQYIQWVTTLNLRLLNLTTGPDSGIEVWPSAWRHGILLPIRSDSLPFLLSSLSHFPHLIHFCLVQHVLPFLRCTVCGWLMDDCRSEFITSTGSLDMDTTHPIPTSSSSWLGHQTHHCILLLLPVVSSPLVAELSLPPLHHLSRWWHPSHVTPDRLLCVMSRCLILHLYPVSHC